MLSTTCSWCFIFLHVYKSKWIEANLQHIYSETSTITFINNIYLKHLVQIIPLFYCFLCHLCWWIKLKVEGRGRAAHRVFSSPWCQRRRVKHGAAGLVIIKPVLDTLGYCLLSQAGLLGGNVPNPPKIYVVSCCYCYMLFWVHIQHPSQGIL